MGTVVVRRPPRRPAPEVPAGELVVEAPPEIPAPTGARWQQTLMVLPMLGGGVAMAMMMGRGGGPYSYVVGALFGLSSLAMLVTYGSAAGSPRKAAMLAARREYLRHLATLRRRVRATVDRQRVGAYYRHPDPDRLWSTVDSHRLWERRPSDSDFGVVRVAVGPQTLATPLVPPATRPLEDLEPMTAGALRRFLDAYSVVPDLPVALSLRSFARVYVRGDRTAVLALVRAMVIQLAAFHAPDDLRVAIAAAPGRRPAWEFVKWLPHARHPLRSDALGPVRLVAGSATAFEPLLAGRRADEPHLLLVVDGAEGVDGPAVTTLHLDGRPPRVLDRVTLVLEVGPDGRLDTRTADGRATVGVADGVTATEAEAVARRLAPRRLARSRGADAEPTSVPRLADLLGVDDPATYTVARGWAARPDHDRLRVAIGVGADGAPVALDLKESAEDGMGPHGLVIGATGSGKSELLRTLVLGLAARHHPDLLNLVLVDFKGGATFTSLDRLPHTAAVITNLADALPLVDRMADAINGELIRRQEVLRSTGPFTSIRDHEKARAAGAPLDPLPSLLIVCDEFSELLAAKPDFIDLFLQIGRVGRSLGVHLLLASQRLEEGRLRGLDTHLSYRIGLRTFSELESRAVLGVPDAHELPRSPGHGILRFGIEPLVRFRAAYVSGPAPVPAADATAGRVRPFTTREVEAPASAPVPADDGPTVLDAIVDRLAGKGPPAHRVWLPPLSDPPALDDLIDGSPGHLRVPLGLVDRPLDQRREPLWLALDGAAGHVAVVGGPQSGKSTALRSLVCALALTHTPAQVQVYGLDFGGGGLASVSGLPHVGGIAGRLDGPAVRRTVNHVAGVLAERERRTGPTTDVFLVVDGWPTLRAEYDDLEPVITDIATRGLSYGVHVAASAPRWTDFRPAIRDLFGSRVELRLGDAIDSLVSRSAASRVPEGAPGRGITADGLHFLTVRPGLSTGDTAALVEAVSKTWTGPPAPPVRMLPMTVPYDDLELTTSAGLRLPIGLAEADLGPAVVDFAAEPHLLLFGDAECGKSSFLRALATTVTRRFAPEEARIIVVDHRRSLLGAIDTDHLIGYGMDPAGTAELMESAAGYLRGRRPGPDVTSQQLRDRSWWTGPELFVLVDDYDLVGPEPLRALVEHLAHARDVGLHLVVARRAGGAGRALFEPVVQRLRDLSSPTLVMSGNPDEGALAGSVRPAPMPAGRGWLITRRDGVRLVQLAYAPG